MSKLNRFFFEIHNGLPRQAPGSEKSTLRALKAIPYLPGNPQIADMGCGPGKSSLLLAKHTAGEISALDIHQPFLDRLSKDAKAQKLENRIKVQYGDMQTPPYQKESFDLIWSEGAIYLLGFERGLNIWRPFLKPGAYIAVSHLSWLTKTPSKAALDFWMKEYPDIAEIEDNIKIIEKAKFKLIDHFVLPKSDWWDEYYVLEEKRIISLLGKYPDDAEALEAANKSQREINLWKQHGDDYGYVFYIAQKT